VQNERYVASSYPCAFKIKGWGTQYREDWRRRACGWWVSGCWDVAEAAAERGGGPLDSRRRYSLYDVPHGAGGARPGCEPRSRDGEISRRRALSADGSASQAARVDGERAQSHLRGRWHRGRPRRDHRADDTQQDAAHGRPGRWHL